MRTYTPVIQVEATPERMEKARLTRLLDRPRCKHVEVGIIGKRDMTNTLRAVALHRAGISADVYKSPKAALTDEEDADFLLFADTLKLRCAVTGAETILSEETLVDSVMNELVKSYLPLDWDAMWADC